MRSADQRWKLRCARQTIIFAHKTNQPTAANVEGHAAGDAKSTCGCLSDWEKAHVDALRRALVMRHVPLVRSLSGDPDYVAIARLDAEAQRLLDEAAAWLPEASAYEEVNGALSLVDRESKDWLMLVDVRAALRKTLASRSD
jgi:hypothetical protein